MYKYGSFVLMLFVFFNVQVNARLSEAPDSIECYHEMAVVYQQNLPEIYNNLTPQERVFCYYLYRACLPVNRLCADQLHRASVEITELFEELYERKTELEQCNLPFDVHQFIADIKTYLVYLWTNHSQYFMKENADEKRSPARIGLVVLTAENLCAALQALGHADAKQKVEQLSAYIFDHTYEPTASVAGSIEQSAMNLYEDGFTESDFQQLSLDEQSRLNSYCCVHTEKGKRIARIMVAKVGGKYDAELSVCLYWIQKALEHARNYPEQFDEYLIESLEYLGEFLKTGDEHVFKKHSIAWLKSNSRIDYNFGPVESYLDPKAYRGLFQADITIKSLNMDAVNALLPTLEVQLPFPAEYKRDNLMEGGASCPNASINSKVFTAGHLGPLNKILAYCLPNYEEIRSKHGSKQIIYAADKSIGQKMNPAQFNALFRLPEDNAWAQKYDPEFQLRRDIFMLHVILHETLGHGSGKFAEHTFVEGDPMVIDGQNYKIGEKIHVTSANEQIFLGGYRAALEELRAEIIALLSSINNYDDIACAGLLGQWPEKVEKQQIVAYMIKDMCEFAFSKWQTLSEKTGKVAGAHALANTTILNYLVEHGGVALVKEQTEFEGQKHIVLGLRIVDVKKALVAITDLACQVQKIKSTADGMACKKLFETYGNDVRNPEHIALLKHNMEVVTGEVKISAMLFPHFSPVVDEKGDILDIDATWPHDIFEQKLHEKNLMFARS